MYLYRTSSPRGTDLLLDREPRGGVRGPPTGALGLALSSRPFISWELGNHPSFVGVSQTTLSRGNAGPSLGLGGASQRFQCPSPTRGPSSPQH